MGGKKISALTESTTVPSNSYTIIVDGTVNKKIKLETITKDLSDRVDAQGTTISNLSNKVNTQETTTNNLSDRLTGLEGELSVNINKVNEQGTTITNLSNKVDTQEIVTNSLSDRVNEVNEQLETIVSLSNNSNVDLMKAKRIAHRGYNVLAPENSIPAYEKAGEYGFWGAECDIAETLDHEFVIMHNDTIDRTTNGTGNVASLTLEQLKSYNIDVGNNIDLYPNLKIPTLEEYLLTCKKVDIVPVIEVKNISDASLDKFLDIIRSYGLINKAVIISFNYELLVKIRNKEKRITIQPLLTLTEENIDKCVALGVNTHIDCNQSEVTKELVDIAHKKGLLVNVWTVTSQEKLTELIGYGVDFITTDNLYDEETATYQLKTLRSSLTPMANQITTIQLGSSNTTPGLTYETMIYKATKSNRCSTVNRFYKALNDTVVIDIPPEYKITLMPFDVNGLYLKDYGWFTSGKTNISTHTDVDHYHLYFAKVDGTNFTEDDISILKEKVSITFKTSMDANIRKYLFYINKAPMVLQSGYSGDTCTVEYEGDETKLFKLTHNKPLTTSYIGMAFGHVSLSGDMNIEVRVKSETKTGFKFGFIDRRTASLMTKTQIETYGGFYFNLIHVG